MASVYHLFARADSIVNELIRENELLEAPVKEHHFAAIKIQSAYRGYRVRKEIKRWHAAATTIQKYVRGWLTRWHLPYLLKLRVFYLRLRYANAMATIIQAAWRGYRVRKSMPMSIKDRVQKKLAIEREAEKRRQEISRSFAALKNNSMNALSPEERAKLEKECKQWVIFILFKLHHLIRTKQIEGVYSLHGRDQLSQLEKWLVSLRMKPYMEQLRKTYNYLKKLPRRQTQYMFQDKRWRHLEDLFRTRDTPCDNIRETPGSDRNIQDRSFDLYKKPKTEKYERKMLYDDRYLQVEQCFRDEDKKIFPKFDLHLTKIAQAKADVPPYHINFWQEYKCSKHYPPS